MTNNTKNRGCLFYDDVFEYKPHYILRLQSVMNNAGQGGMSIIKNAYVCQVSLIKYELDIFTLTETLR